MIKDKFFGRANYLQILEKRIIPLKEGYRQNIAVIGDEFVGKTSIIFKLLERIYDSRLITVYLDVRHEPLAAFAKRFIGVLLYNFMSNSGIELKEDLDFLIKKSGPYLPKTLLKIKSILNAVKKGKRCDVLPELLNLCESVYEESGKSCVLILDEFLNLESLGIKNLYREWSKLLILQKHTMYIITSSLKFKARFVLSKNLSLLFGNFEQINVEPFDIASSELYLENKLNNPGLEAFEKDFLVHFTGGYPLYLEVLTDALLKQTNEALADILENLLFDASGMLNQKFTNYLKRFHDMPNSSDYISILYLIASGRNKIKDISHVLKKQNKEVLQRVNHLLELDTITKSGDFLSINDRVFNFWLRFVHQEKQNSLTFDAKHQKELFRSKIEAMIQEFVLQSKRPLAERLSEILRLFEDEVVLIERKKIRLNHFREIKHLEFHNRLIKDGLLGRSSESLWILGIKKETLSEEDISEFSKECKKYRHKLQRKIIVTLKEIEPNTRLKALEEKVWAWDINSLNQMLDLFSKPRVIV